MEATALLDDDEFEASTPSARSDILVRHYETESVVWSPDAQEPVYLDPVAALVFQLLGGDVSVGALIADVHEVLGIPEAIAQKQLRRVVAMLDRGAILERSTMPAGQVDASLDLFPAPPNP